MLLKISTILNTKEFNNEFNKIFKFIKDVIQIYPNSQQWYEVKVKEGLFDGTREIFYLKENDNILAICICKKDSIQYKICTLYVKEEFRNQGYATLLLENAFHYLNTTKTIISIPLKIVPYFEWIIKKNNWQLTSSNNNNNFIELLYNEKELNI